MAFLRRISFSLLILLFLTSGCATSSYKLIKQNRNAAELKVTPDRVLLECEYQPDHDTKDAYGFMMRILDDEKTVLTATQTNVLDKGSCLRRIQKIGKILKTGKIIYVGGAGSLIEPRTEGKQMHTFPDMGTFYENGRHLQFLVIANEQGLCYDAYSGDENPCPREPFSLKNLK